MCRKALMVWWNILDTVLQCWKNCHHRRCHLQWMNRPWECCTDCPYQHQAHCQSRWHCLIVLMAWTPSWDSRRAWAWEHREKGVSVDWDAEEDIQCAWWCCLGSQTLGSQMVEGPSWSCDAPGAVSTVCLQTLVACASYTWPKSNIDIEYRYIDAMFEEWSLCFQPSMHMRSEWQETCHSTVLFLFHIRVCLQNKLACYSWWLSVPHLISCIHHTSSLCTCCIDFSHNLTLYKWYIFSQPHPAQVVHTIYTSWLYNITLYKLWRYCSPHLVQVVHSSRIPPSWHSVFTHSLNKVTVKHDNQLYIHVWKDKCKWA